MKNADSSRTGSNSDQESERLSPESTSSDVERKRFWWLEEFLMALGALVWVVGELIAVRKGEDTTTSYVRRGKHVKRFGFVVLTACIVGCGWLFGHFVFDLWG